MLFENFGRDGRFENDGFSNRDFHNGEPRYYCDFTGDGYLDVLKTDGGASNTAKSITVRDGKKHGSLSITQDFATVQEKFLCEAAEDGWKITVDGKSSYVMTGAIAKDTDLYPMPRLHPDYYYVTEYSEDERSAFYTGGFSLKRCFIHSPHSTVVPVQDWPKNYLESFLTDEKKHSVVSGSVMGSGMPTLVAYNNSDDDDLCVYMAIGYGAVYIPIELELPKENCIPRAVQIIGGNSQELSLVVDLGTSDNGFYQFDYLV